MATKRKHTKDSAGMAASSKSPKKAKKQKDGNNDTEGATGTTDNERFRFFYGNTEVFSQFFPCKFTVDGIEYNCMEQYMHHQKAVVFKDDQHAKEIMATDEPRKQKAFGRKVENFEKEVWSKTSIDVVRKGNLAKYRQNPELMKELLDTYPKMLVEASPRDRLWGIGLGKNNPKARDPSQWRGKNLLGKVLTEVRDILMKENNSRVRN